MSTERVTLLRFAVLAFSLFAVLACRSQLPAGNTTAGNSATVTPSGATTQPASSTNSNAQAAGAKSGGDCASCFLHIYDDKDFKATDDNHILCGPGKFANLRSLPGATKFNWGDEIESLKVGPNATVKVWIGENFTGPSQTFGPGTEKFTLKDLPGMSDQISSIEITCQ